MKISSLIKRYRASKRISQGRLAADLKITQNYLSMIELDKKRPSPTLINRFIEISGISANAIWVLLAEVPLELNSTDKAKFHSLQQTIEELYFSEQC